MGKFKTTPRLDLAHSPDPFLAYPFPHKVSQHKHAIFHSLRRGLGLALSRVEWATTVRHWEENESWWKISRSGRCSILKISCRIFTEPLGWFRVLMVALGCALPIIICCAKGFQRGLVLTGNTKIAENSTPETNGTAVESLLGQQRKSDVITWMRVHYGSWRVKFAGIKGKLFSLTCVCKCVRVCVRVSSTPRRRPCQLSTRKWGRPFVGNFLCTSRRNTKRDNPWSTERMMMPLVMKI